MSISWLVTNLLAAFLLPPLSLVILGLCGLVWMRRSVLLGRSLVAASVLLLVVLSTPIAARLLSAPLEQRSLPVASVAGSRAQAIVILGAGRLHKAPDAGGNDLPSTHTLMRLRHGARLHRQTGLPILVSGGMPDGAAVSEAALMAQSLREDFRVPVRWLEDRSDNTAQNAQGSARQLAAAGVTRVFLVTDALHMPRAAGIFAHNGLDVIKAPTNFMAQRPLSPDAFIPSASALGGSHYALHEWIGLVWYGVRHGSP